MQDLRKFKVGMNCVSDEGSDSSSILICPYALAMNVKDNNSEEELGERSCRAGECIMFRVDSENIVHCALARTPLGISVPY